MKTIVCSIFYFLSLNLSAQAVIDSIVGQLKQHNYTLAQKEVERIKSPVLKNAFSYAINYKLFGKGTFYHFEEEGLSSREIIINYYTYGDHLTHKKVSQDSLAYVQYKYAYNLAKKVKDTLLLQECLLRICQLQFYYQLPFRKTSIDYVSQIEEYSKGRIDRYWHHYFSLNRRIDSLYQEEKPTEAYPSDLEKSYKKLIDLAGDISYLKGLAFHSAGIYYDLFKDKGELSATYFESAVEIFSTKKNNFFDKNAQASLINLAILMTEKGQHKDAIKVLKKADKEYHIFDNTFEKLFIYDGLYKNYKALGSLDSAFFYLELNRKKEKELQKDKNALYINNIESDEEYFRKKKELKALITKNTKLQRMLSIMWPSFGIVFLIVIILYFTYKKSRQEVKIIAEKVIKNHIVLNDKTKIYINDLLYVKAEDHYIRLFISDGKNHLVRGSLSDLEAQLPPNFIRVHRSYIINRNYIRSFSVDQIHLINGENIPIGRTYRKKIDP